MNIYVEQGYFNSIFTESNLKSFTVATGTTDRQFKYTFRSYKGTAIKLRDGFVCLYHINVPVKHMQAVYGQTEAC